MSSKTAVDSKLSIKEQMTKMIIDFEKRDKSIGFTKEEYENFNELAQKTFLKQQRVGEIKNNGFSLYYCSMREYDNGSHKDEYYLNKGFKLKNPFCAYNLAYDYVRYINKNFDVKILKQYCDIAESVGNGDIYFSLFDCAGYEVNKNRENTYIGCVDWVYEKLINICKQRSTEFNDAKSQTELAKYFYNLDDLPTALHYINLAIERTNPDLDCVLWVLNNNIGHINGKEMLYLQIATNYMYDIDSTIKLIHLYYSLEMYMDMIPLINKLKNNRDLYDMHRHDILVMIDEKLMVKIMNIYYKNKLEMGIECEKDLSHIDSNANIALARFYRNQTDWDRMIDYLEPISYNLKLVRDEIQHINFYTQLEYMTYVYVQIFNINSYESLEKYVCRDIIRIIVSYNNL